MWEWWSALALVDPVLELACFGVEGAGFVARGKFGRDALCFSVVSKQVDVEEAGELDGAECGGLPCDVEADYGRGGEGYGVEGADCGAFEEVERGGSAGRGGGYGGGRGGVG